MEKKWKNLFGVTFFIAVCMILISCGGEPVVPIPQIIDISNDEVLDEYVDIMGSTTPSLFTNQENPLELPPFSQTLNLVFLESETSSFVVEFLGEQYPINFGTLEIDINGVEAGVYPLSIRTSAKASARDPQTQIWVKVENVIELPEVDLTQLEKSRVEFSLIWDTGETEEATIAVYLRSDEAGEGLPYTVATLVPNDVCMVELSGLQEGQAYQLGLRRENEPQTNWLWAFNTFSAFDRGLQLFYWLDLSQPQTHQVAVKVFGYYKDIPSLTLDNSGYHTQGGMARGSAFDCVGNPQIFMNLQNNNQEVVFDLNGNNEGFFRLSYQSDKSVIETDNHGVQGYFGEDYLIASHEQLLYGPANTLQNYLTQDTRMNNFSAHLYLKLNNGWTCETGWKESILGLYQLPSAFDHCLPEFFRAANIYAYKSDQFKSLTNNYGDSQLRIILSDDLDEAYFDDILLINEKLMAIWGSQMPIEKYTLIFPESPSDDQLIYAGEWSTGQGFSTNWGIIGEMLVHQMYHVWNAWAVGIPWDHSNGNHKFWTEGFNEFFDDKILSSLDFETTTLEDHQWLKGWYNQYVAIRGTAGDLNLLEGEGHLPGNLEYFKGAVYAFALDREISDRTNGEFSLDDLLRYMWEQYLLNDTMASYEMMLEFFDDIVPNGMRDWAQAYLGNNESLYLYDFEQNPPLFAVSNPHPTTRSTDVSQTVTLTWEEIDRADYDLTYDVYLGELNGTKGPVESVYTGLSNPTQEVSLKANTQYIWRVKAHDGEGQEYISPVWFFTTGEDIPPDPFCTNVSVSQARDIIDANEGNEDFIILDVRRPSEYNSGHIENAVNVNFLDDFQEHMEPFVRTKTYLVYCQSGGRSSQAVDIMFNDMGFTKIYHMYQGYSNWSSSFH